MIVIEGGVAIDVFEGMGLVLQQVEEVNGPK